MWLLLGFVALLIIISAVTIIVLKKVIFEDTTSAINRINKLDMMNREKEKALASKLDETNKFLESRKKELEEEEKRLKLEAQRAATQLQEDILKKAKTEAEDIVKKANASREKMRIEAIIEAESKIIDVCRDILSKVLSSLVQSEMNGELVREFVKELEEADLSKVGKDVHTIDILSGRSMSTEIKQLVTDLLNKKLDRKLEIVFKDDHELMGGIVMKFGSMVIDGSLLERLKETSDKMKDELSWKHTA